ncbi:Os06g0481200, partial [Oryza sativa Japonica Group]
LSGHEAVHRWHDRAHLVAVRLPAEWPVEAAVAALLHRRELDVLEAQPGARRRVAARQIHGPLRVRPRDAAVRHAGHGHRRRLVGARRVVAVVLVDHDRRLHRRHAHAGEQHAPHRPGPALPRLDPHPRRRPHQGHVLHGHVRHDGHGAALAEPADADAVARAAGDAADEHARAAVLDGDAVVAARHGGVLDGDADGAGEVDAVRVWAVARRSDGDAAHLDGAAGVEGEVEPGAVLYGYPCHRHVRALVHPQS